MISKDGFVSEFEIIIRFDFKVSSPSTNAVALILFSPCIKVKSKMKGDVWSPIGVGGVDPFSSSLNSLRSVIPSRSLVIVKETSPELSGILQLIGDDDSSHKLWSLNVNVGAGIPSITSILNLPISVLESSLTVISQPWLSTPGVIPVTLKVCCKIPWSSTLHFDPPVENLNDESGSGELWVTSIVEVSPTLTFLS